MDLVVGNKVDCFLVLFNSWRHESCAQASSFQKRTNEQKMSHKYSQTVTTPVYDKELTSDRREIVYTLVVVGIRKVISVNIAYISLA